MVNTILKLLVKLNIYLVVIWSGKKYLFKAPKVCSSKHKHYCYRIKFVYLSKKRFDYIGLQKISNRKFIFIIYANSRQLIF